MKKVSNGKFLHSRFLIIILLVLDQTLKNNSYVSLINTNVTRSRATYDANVTGGLFKLANKKNTYALNGRGALSQLYKPELSGPDAGYTMSLRAAKSAVTFSMLLPRRLKQINITRMIWVYCIIIMRYHNMQR